MKVRYERGALADLDEIFAYIARDNQEAAARLVARIEQTVARIAETRTWATQHGNQDSADFQ
jgi:toxin ParE1/3/4